MIVHDFNVVRVAFAPVKTDSPLVVDANAVLSLSSAFQGFEPVARRHGHLPQFRSCVQQQQFPSGAALNIGWEAAGQFRPEHPLGFRAHKAQNHSCIITLRVMSVKCAIARAVLNHDGKSLPVVVTVNLPCLTPLAEINSSAIRRINAALPRTSKTSRQL